MSGWVIDEETMEKGIRYDLPAEAREECKINNCYIMLRPLTDAEALCRESAGIVEWYYFDGREPSVRRTYDLAAMAEHDHKHCVLDFRLPIADKDESRAIEMDPKNPSANLQILKNSPPKLAAWVSECIADVNMRTPEKRQHLETAKKN